MLGKIKVKGIFQDTCNCQSSTRAVRVLDGSQQKADVVKTDYSNSLLMITRM